MSERLDVRKTYKLYVGGQFPRSESGRTYPVNGPDGGLLAHAVLGSRKDLRDAVKAARGAQAGWAGKTAYNRAQILYRVGEIMEGRRSQFVDELAAGGVDDPEGEVDAVDRPLGLVRRVGRQARRRCWAGPTPWPGRTSTSPCPSPPVWSG